MRPSGGDHDMVDRFGHGPSRSFPRIRIIVHRRRRWCAHRRRLSAARSSRSGFRPVRMTSAPSRAGAAERFRGRFRRAHRSRPRSGRAVPVVGVRGPGSSRGDDEHDLVDRAPAPVLARLDRAQDGMPLRARVLRRMLVGRTVTAADLAAALTHPQVHPAGAGGEAFLGAFDPPGGLGEDDLVLMRAGSSGTYRRAASGPSRP